MIQFLECVKNDGLPDFFRVGDIFECEEYDETSYKVNFKKDGKVLKARIGKDYFKIPDINMKPEEEVKIDNPLEFIVKDLKEKNITIQVCVAYFNNIAQILNTLYFNTDADKELLNDMVARKVVEASVAIEVLSSTLGLQQEDIDRYKEYFLQDMAKNLKNNKILV